MSTLLTCTSTTRPASPATGDILYETDTAKSIIYDGATWRVYASDSSSYDLDGTNTVSVRPKFHFDAEKFNGVDSSGNPSDSTKVDTSTVWTSRVDSTTAFQDTASQQPSFRTTGTNSKPYIENTAYMGLETSEIFTASGAFTAFGIIEATTARKVAVIGGGAFGGTAPKDNIDFVWSGTHYLYFSRTGTDNGALPLTINSGEMRAYLLVRDSSNNTSLFMDGDNTTATVVGTNSDIQYISSLMINVSPYGLIGNCYEVAFWNSDLSTANRNALGAYAQAKYGSGNLGWTNFT